jgi:hemoglobin
MNAMRRLAAAAVAAALTGCCGQEKTSGPPDPNSLYARIGGLNGLARATDAMVNRVLTDEVILQNRELQMRAKPENVPGLKVQITNLLSSLTGGPEFYGGKSMKEAHLGMGVTEAQWEAFMKACAAGLDDAKVAAKEKQEVLDLFASMKADIVEAK